MRADAPGLQRRRADASRYHLKLWREYRAAVCADDAEQMAELERLFGLDGKQESARMIEQARDLDGEEGEE